MNVVEIKGDGKTMLEKLVIALIIAQLFKIEKGGEKLKLWKLVKAVPA